MEAQDVVRLLFAEDVRQKMSQEEGDIWSNLK